MPYIKIRLRPDRQIRVFSLPWQKNWVKTLARRIELKLQHGPWQHCAVYEDELQRLWPLEAPYREARIANFAVRYGFRLEFYQKGLCAIFEKAAATTEKNLPPGGKKKWAAFLKLERGGCKKNKQRAP